MFLRNGHTDSPDECQSLHSHQQWVRALPCWSLPECVVTAIPDGSHSDRGEELSEQLGHFYAVTQCFPLVSVGNFSVFKNKKGFSQAIASLRTQSHIKILLSSLVTVTIHLVTLVGSRSSWRAAQHSSGWLCLWGCSREISEGGKLCPVCVPHWSVGCRPRSIKGWRGSSWLKHPVSASCLATGELLCSHRMLPCHDALPNHEPKVTEPTDPGQKSPIVNSPQKALHFIVGTVTALKTCPGC